MCLEVVQTAAENVAGIAKRRFKEYSLDVVTVKKRWDERY